MENFSQVVLSRTARWRRVWGGGARGALQTAQSWGLLDDAQSCHEYRLRPTRARQLTPPASASWSLPAGTPNDPMRAILGSATSSKFLSSLLRHRPSNSRHSAELEGPGQPTSHLGRGRGPRLWPHSSAAEHAAAGGACRGGPTACALGQKLHSTQHPNPELERASGTQGSWLGHHRPGD